MVKPSIQRLVLRRLWGDKALLIGVFIGMSLATTLSAAAPIYLNSLSQLSFNISLDRLSKGELRLKVFAPKTTLTENSIQKTEDILDLAIENHLSEIYAYRERFLKGGDLILGREETPLPALGDPPTEVLIGQFVRLSNLENHITVIEGRMAGDTVFARERGPEVEVAVGTESVEKYQLGIGDILTLAPDLQIPTRVTARVVGIIEPDDLNDGYWSSAGIYVDPPPLGDLYNAPSGVIVDDSLSPVTLFVSEKIMVNGIGGAYPGTVVLPVWDMVVSRDQLKRWPLSQSRSRFESFEKQLIDEMPGSTAGLGMLQRLLTRVDRKSFFASVPLLLLLGVMVVAVLFYLSMLISYLVSSRQDDSARLRTRGVGILQLLRLYAAEGLVIALIAASTAPILALGAVAVAGKLPYFREMTMGGFLPLQPSFLSIALAASSGTICLLIYVAAGLVGARVELLAHKLRASRPPSIPFFHRYYMDVAILAIGGLAFWELQSRGHFISAGPLKDLEINEALLLTPALFLVVVALTFIRFFPMAARYVAGESPSLIHLLAIASLGTLISLVVVNGIRAGIEFFGWAVPAAILAAAGTSYVLTSLKTGRWHQWLLLTVQAVLVWLFFTIEPLQPSDISFLPAVILITLVPAQVTFLLLRTYTGAMPVWLSIGLWRMARSPLQYSWLVLLLVLATGLGVLSATVGGTLERSQLERIQYALPTDLRVKVSSIFVPGGIHSIRDKFDGTPFTEGSALAFRSSGNFGHLNFQILGLEPEEFGEIAWYREDFSSRPLSSIMNAMNTNESLAPIAIPEGATEISAWIKPLENYPSLYLWMVIEDGTGALTTISLGELGGPEWELMTAALPRNLELPISLASVQIYEPSPTSLALLSFKHVGKDKPSELGSAIRVSEIEEHRGLVLIDEIHANGPSLSEPKVLEDFENGVDRWTPIFTSFDKSDTLSINSTEVYSGQYSSVFEFGLARNRWVRGFYQSRVTGPYIPVVMSSSLASSSGLSVGDYFVATISGRLTPLVVIDTVSLFPTTGPEGSGFLLADLDLLLGYLNLFGHPSRENANELYVNWKKPGMTQPISEIVGEPAARRIRVEDGAAQLSSVLIDPLSTAGWRTLVLVSLGVLLLAAGMGYVAYLLLLSHNNRLEMGFLRSLGLSRSQLVAMLTFEHFAVAALGLGLGTWAGLHMSRMTVSPLAVTDVGDPVVPPFLLLTEWALLVPVYAALIAIFLGSLAVLALSVSKLELHAILRGGEK